MKEKVIEMVKLAKVMMIFLVLLVVFSNVVRADQASVLDGFINMQSGEKIKVIPLELGITLYDKKPKSDGSYEIISLPSNPADSDQAEEYSKKIETQMGKSLMGWSTTRGTIVEVPCGPNAPIIAEISPQFFGVNNIRYLKALLGVTELPVVSRGFKGRIVYLDMQTVPEGPRFFSFNLGHKDDLSITQILAKFTNQKPGEVSLGIELSCVSAPEFYPGLSLEGKRSYIQGARSTNAVTSLPEVVQQDIQKMEQEKIAASKATLILHGNPGAEIEYGYIGTGTMKTTLNTQGQVTLGNVDPERTIKVAYSGNTTWQEITLGKGEVKTVELKPLIQTPTIAATTSATTIYEFKFINDSQKNQELNFEFKNSNGKIETLTRQITNNTFIRWDVSSDYQVRIKKQTGEVSNWIMMNENREVFLTAIKFSREVAVR